MAGGDVEIASSQDYASEAVLPHNSAIYYSLENVAAVEQNSEDLPPEPISPKGCLCFGCPSVILPKGKVDKEAGNASAMSRVEDADAAGCIQPVQFPLSLLRQPTMTPVPEAKEVIINSKDAEGDNVNFHSMTEEDAMWGVGSDTDTTTGSPDGSRSPLNKQDSGCLKQGGRRNLKQQIGMIFRRLSRAHPGGGILLSEPGNELELCTGSIGPKELAKLSELNGTWKLDNRASDSHDALCKAMRLGWTYRKAMDNESILKIECTIAEVMYTVQIPGLLSLVERRPWSGELVEHERRDVHEGTMLGSVQRYSDGLVLRSEWIDPLAGSMKEYIQLCDGGRSLVVRLDLRRTGGTGYKEAHMRMIYRRIA